ncbi:hypothetical protein P775_22140 [Puniceibacterium antarcticum]|uniref:Uncharacterized protein n=2 Tax=Puniceibacterium antarcticum TaxID=1206336 RepID=A0A2G8R8Z2_9RHOB|nr:hypothetical protein P775_22140 [Puniceibacterium antarcticum]
MVEFSLMPSGWGIHGINRAVKRRLPHFCRLSIFGQNYSAGIVRPADIARLHRQKPYKAGIQAGDQNMTQDHEFAGPMKTKTGRLSIYAVGMRTGIFLAISFVLCVGFGLIFPTMTMYQAWLPLLPGFAWISLSSFVIGLVESFAYGWFVAVLFVPLFNYFSERAAK